MFATTRKLSESPRDAYFFFLQKRSYRNLAREGLVVGAKNCIRNNGNFKEGGLVSSL